jgi:hypothetical protein
LSKIPKWYGQLVFSYLRFWKFEDASDLNERKWSIIGPDMNVLQTILFIGSPWLGTWHSVSTSKTTKASAAQLKRSRRHEKTIAIPQWHMSCRFFKIVSAP